jgi:hypothetical protein
MEAVRGKGRNKEKKGTRERGRERDARRRAGG